MTRSRKPQKEAMSIEQVEVVVVGGGQAGIALSEHLSNAGVPHLILERGRVAEKWRSGRWDSLVANGPAWHDRFPGLEFDTAPDAFVPKEQVADLLAAPDVPRRLVEAWLAAGGPVETRLLAALASAIAAGGEAGPVHSAGLSVINGSGWRVTDLRVDWSADPLADLTALLGVWLPQRDAYITRALNPAAAPAYGVPGDE